MAETATTSSPLAPFATITPPTTTLFSLPDELLISILQVFATKQRRKLRAWQFVRPRTKTLKRCCLVSKRFLEIARAVLYRDLHVVVQRNASSRTGYHPLSLLLTTFASSPNLCSIPRSIHFSNESHSRNLLKVLDICPYLRSIHLFDYSPPATRSLFELVRSPRFRLTNLSLSYALRLSWPSPEFIKWATSFPVVEQATPKVSNIPGRLSGVETLTAPSWAINLLAGCSNLTLTTLVVHNLDWDKHLTSLSPYRSLATLSIWIPSDARFIYNQKHSTLGEDNPLNSLLRSCGPSLKHLQLVHSSLYGLTFVTLARSIPPSSISLDVSGIFAAGESLTAVLDGRVTPNLERFHFNGGRRNRSEQRRALKKCHERGIEAVVEFC